MKNTDKITLTIGQLKRLISESIEDYSYHNTKLITYNDVLNDLDGEDIEDVIVNYGEDLADWLQDFYLNATNWQNLQNAILKMAKLINQGRSVESLRREFGKKAI